MWAIGAYTRTSHTEMNTAYAENFRRSAVAPVISAGVMIANVIWNAQNSTNGMVKKARKLSGCDSLSRAGPTSFIQANSKLPMNPPLPASPNAKLNTTASQSTPRMPIAKKFCMSMPRTFLLRTMPP